MTTSSPLLESRTDVNHDSVNRMVSLTVFKTFEIIREQHKNASPEDFSNWLERQYSALAKVNGREDLDAVS